MQIKPLGDVVVVELDEITKVGSIHLPEDNLIYKNEMQKCAPGTVMFVGTTFKYDDVVDIGAKVLVKTFVGATPVKFNDKTLRLYKSDDVLALLT